MSWKIVTDFKKKKEKNSFRSRATTIIYYNGVERKCRILIVTTNAYILLYGII